ncbi:phage gp6-like head-tail connector protein [Streptomyces alboflavus]|nr:phage gp6-like head-tail connector protein [Streptomyces alboflavus]
MGRPLTPEETPRVTAFLQDVTGLAEDFCGRDLVRRDHQALTLVPQHETALRIPSRHTAYLTVLAVHQDGRALTDWTLRGRLLVRDAGWGGQLVTVTASWGYPTPPASLTAVVCAEVIRWLAVAPGVEREKVGEVEVEFSGASSAQSLGPAARAGLKPYRRPGLGTLTLRRAEPSCTR